eukprot:gb/GECH01011603.1/.p1 GENE.gb/GECH01011603.1/~~gb/GECH01011603.1/.p1  ORF type:complete len:553 (+),score=109.22 gb/GECH01011603.1/:1-1659(+)
MKSYHSSKVRSHSRTDGLSSREDPASTEYVPSPPAASYYKNSSSNRPTTTTTTKSKKEESAVFNTRLAVIVTTLLNYASLMFFGYFRDFFRYFFPSKSTDENNASGELMPMVKGFEDFYIRRLYGRVHDCWGRPVSSRPGAWIDVYDIESQTHETSPGTAWKNQKPTHALNLGSYNYLGFADASHLEDDLLNAVDTYGVALGSPALEMGTTQLHHELEQTVADFVGQEDSMVFGMGFATNLTTIPAIVGPGDLILSDSLNHASIVLGARASGAKVKVFRHGDMNHLETLVRDSIAYGQPHVRRAWRRVMILVEGIYSMEGEIVNLPKIVEIKRKYKCYIYVDEAHSIGAIGQSGRGVAEYYGVNPRDIDIMMGTFTKSFGSVGGYIAGSQRLIEYLRTISWGNIYSSSMAPVCAQQIISSMHTLLGKDGTNLGQEKLNALRENSNWFRSELLRRGFVVFGDHDSPVVPVIVCNPAKVVCFSREALKRNLALVVVGFPATPLLESRVRFCISSAHTRKDLEHAISVIDEIGDLVLVKYNHQNQKALTSTAECN